MAAPKHFGPRPLAEGWEQDGDTESVRHLADGVHVSAWRIGDQWNADVVALRGAAAATEHEAQVAAEAAAVVMARELLRVLAPHALEDSCPT